MQIIPAILTRTSDEALEQADRLRGVAPWLQLDVMDGTMTDASTCDLYDLVGELEDFSVEVHLMVDDPTAYFAACDALGAKRVYIHTEPLAGVADVLEVARGHRFAVGIAVSPQTTIAQIEPYIDDVDAVLVLTVEPGRQGQHFISEMLEKVEELRADYPELWIAVDGGVSVATIRDAAQSGASAAAVGSAISAAADPVGALRILKTRAAH